MNRIFVYGTLKREHDTQNWIKNMRFLGQGKIEAKLYDFGDYPGAVEQSGSYVEGEVYETENIDVLLNLIDQYEEFDTNNAPNSLFIRKVAVVTMGNGRKLHAIVYLYNGDLSKGHPIKNWKSKKEN